MDDYTRELKQERMKSLLEIDKLIAYDTLNFCFKVNLKKYVFNTELSKVEKVIIEEIKDNFIYTIKLFEDLPKNTVCPHIIIKIYIDRVLEIIKGFRKDKDEVIKLLKFVQKLKTLGITFHKPTKNTKGNYNLYMS